MKEYTTTLISLARDDLSLAQSAIVGQPHLAAFHAQQCAEKAIKAVAYELGPFESEAQFRPMAKQVGHNSMIACLQVVGTAIITAMKMAHEEQVRVKIEAGAKLGRSQRTLSSTVGWASRRALKRFFDSEFKKLNVEVKQKHRRKGAWAKSLDPSYDPSKGPRQDRDVKIPLSLRPFIWIYRWTMRKMGIKSEAAYKIDASSNPPEERFRFMDELLTEFKAKGNKDIVTSIENSREIISRATGPHGEVLDWVEQVVEWGPLLDAHAVIGRYPTTTQLSIYKNRPEGVRRLVTAGQMLLDRSVQIIPIATS